MQQRQSGNKTMVLLAAGIVAAVAGVAGSAFARGGGWGDGPGGRRHHRGMRGPRCAKMLMHAPAEVLKEKLQLSDGQIAKLEPVRMNFLTKQIKGQAAIKLNHLKLRRLMRADLPDQNKVLKLMRKQRSIRGRIHEEGLKAYLQGLRIMSPGQRKTLRDKCRRRHQRRFGRFMRRGGFGGPGPFGPRGRRPGGGPGPWWGR